MGAKATTERRRRILTACGLLLLLAPGCAPGPPAHSKIQLTMMLPPSERPFWEPIARAFERAHREVRVELVEGPQSTDLRENLYTASLLARDPTFDLIYMDVTWTAKFAGAGWLIPVDSLFSRDEWDGFLPAALAGGAYDGRVYRVPVRTDVGLLYFRSDLLANAGFEPPRTFAELRRTARELQSPPRLWGFVWQGKQYEGLVCDYLEMLCGHGGFWVDPVTLEVGLDRPEATAALSYMVACIRTDPISPPGIATYQEEESRRIFQDGRAIFLRNWPYVWRLAQSDESPVRGRVGVMPMVRVPGGRSAGTLGGWGLGISAFSRHPRLAMEFIRTATSLEAQRQLCGPTGYAPARREAYRDSALKVSNPFLAELERLHEDAIPRPAIARYALASDILQRHLSAALAGSDSPVHALRSAARETRAMLGRSAHASHAQERAP